MQTYERYQITMTEPERGRVTLTLREKSKKKIARAFITSAQALRILDFIGNEAEVGEKFYGKVLG